MPVSVHEILLLNEKKPILNKFVKFFAYQEKRYGYLNRKPLRISFMELTEGMQNILKQFDGTNTVNDIIVSNSLDVSFFELIKTFYKNYFLSDNKLPPHYPDSASLTLTFFPTTACGLRCLYCYISEPDNTAEMIDCEKADAWINYIFQRIESNIKNIDVWFHGGGEPTLALGRMKQIWNNIKSRCTNLNLNCRLNTISNGTFNRPVSEWLIEEKAFVLFSIDGSRELHDKVRPYYDGKGSFDAAINNLKLLSDSGLKTGIRATASKYNYRKLKDLVDLCKEFKVSFLSIMPCSSYGRDQILNNSSISSGEFIPAYIDAWNYAMDENVRLRGYASLSVMPGRNYFCNDYNETSLCLTSDGCLTACTEVVKKSDPASAAFYAGEINNDNTIIFYEGKINALRQRTASSISQCSSCFLEHVCNSGCAVKAFRYSGKLTEVFSEDCIMMQEISLQILKKILYEPVKYKKPGTEYYSFSSDKRPDIYLKFAAFNGG